MDWSKGYSSRYYATIVDRATWQDLSRFEITGGTIERTDSDLLESADLDCINYSETNEQWIRVWLDTIQDGDYLHTPLFTGLATSPKKSINGVIEKTSIECYSVLKPAQDMLLSRGWYAPIDINGGTLAKRLLSVCGAPIDVAEDAKNLEYAIIAEDGETNLTMAWKVVIAIGWLIRIRSDGTIYIGPGETKSKWGFGVLENDMLEPNVDVEYDWYDCPNVFRANSGGYSAIARDDDPNSLYSVPARGREIWREENDCDLAEGQSLTEYAKSRLNELQQTAVTISYNRRYHPEILVGDVVSLHYPTQNLDGDYLVTSQSITLGHNAQTSEEAVKLWG